MLLFIASSVPALGELPLPLLDQYGIEPASQIVTHEVEAGPANSRRVSLCPHRILSIAWMLKPEEHEQFWEWFYSQDGADAGAAWFSCRAMLGQSVRLVSCKFKSLPKSTPLGPVRWKITSTVDTRDA